jgi:hypothetical protein
LTSDEMRQMAENHFRHDQVEWCRGIAPRIAPK